MYLYFNTFTFLLYKIMQQQLPVFISSTAVSGVTGMFIIITGITPLG